MRGDMTSLGHLLSAVLTGAPIDAPFKPIHALLQDAVARLRREGYNVTQHTADAVANVRMRAESRGTSVRYVLAHGYSHQLSPSRPTAVNELIRVLRCYGELHTVLHVIPAAVVVAAVHATIAHQHSVGQLRLPAWQGAALESVGWSSTGELPQADPTALRQIYLTVSTSSVPNYLRALMFFAVADGSTRVEVRRGFSAGSPPRLSTAMMTIEPTTSVWVVTPKGVITMADAIATFQRDHAA